MEPSELDLKNIEHLAWADLLGAPSEAVRNRLGLRVLERGGVIGLQAQDLASPLLNRLLGLGSAHPASPSEVDEWVSEYRSRGIPRWFVQLAPSARPRDLGPWLEARGLPRYHRGWLRLVRPVGPGDLAHPVLRSTSLRIRAAARPDAEVVGALLSSGFELGSEADALFGAVVGRPGWHAVLAEDAGGPIGVGLLFMRGRAGYLAGGATHPRHRRRGVHQALIAARLRLAAAWACEDVGTETGERVGNQPNPSYDNLVRFGFRPHHVVENHASPGSASGA